MIINKLKSESSFIAKNGLSVFLKLFSVALSFFAFRWLNDSLDPETFADVNVAIAINNFIIGMIEFGIPNVMQQVYTNSDDQNEKDTAWTSLSFLRLISGLVGVVILYLISLTGIISFGLLLAIYLSMYIFLADLQYRAVVDSDNRSWQFSLSDLISKMVFVTGLYFVFASLPIIRDLSVISIYVISIVTSALTAILLDSWMQRTHYNFTKVSIEFLRKYRKPLIYLGLSSLFAGSFMTTDKIFLDVYNASDEVINGYSNTYKLFEVALIIPGITMPVLASTVRKKIKGLSRPDKIKTSKNYTLLAGIVGALVTVGFVVFGPFALRLIDSRSLYLDVSYTALFVLAVGIMLHFSGLFLSYMNILAGNEKMEVLVQISKMVVALILYTVLIYLYSFVGAAISTVLVFLFDVIIRYYTLFNYKKSKI